MDDEAAQRNMNVALFTWGADQKLLRQSRLLFGSKKEDVVKVIGCVALSLFTVQGLLDNREEFLYLNTYNNTNADTLCQSVMHILGDNMQEGLGCTFWCLLPITHGPPKLTLHFIPK
jgi:hypothetical protein